MTSGKSGIEAPRDAGTLDARFVAQAGSRVVGLALLKPMHAPEGRFPQYYPWGNSSVFFTTTGGKRCQREQCRHHRTVQRCRPR